MATIFVSHAFSNNPYRHQKAVRTIARRLVLEGHNPLVPQIYLPQFLDEQTERDLALKLCFEVVALAGEVWVYGEQTDGMRLEIAEAHRLKIPVLQKELPGDREPDGNRSGQRPETMNNQQRVIGSEKVSPHPGGIKSLQLSP